MATTKIFPVSKGISILMLFIGFLFTTTCNAQEIEVRGIVKGKSELGIEILSGANVYIKGTTIATSTNKKGTFVFPRKLKVGDILVFSYLGYLKKRVKIKPNSSYLSVILEEDDNEILGALNSGKRYKSKRH